MAQPHRPPPLETLRDAIAEALWGAVSAPALPAACVTLGLRDGDSAEAMNSKRKYVRSRITTFKGPELLALAHRVVEEYGAADLADYVSELTTHADHRITDLTRRAVLAELVSAGELFGDLPVWDGVAVLCPDLDKPARYSTKFAATLRADIQRHYIQDNDLNNAELLELCGALTCSQQRFVDMVEKVVDAVCRRGKEQERLVQSLNKLLAADGFVLAVVGEVSRHPLYGMRRAASGVAGDAEEPDLCGDQPQAGPVFCGRDQQRCRHCQRLRCSDLRPRSVRWRPALGHSGRLVARPGAA